MSGGIHVFLGSTLRAEEARTHLESAHFLPPIQQGDILRLLPQKPRVIGIVDGLFRAIPAVWHKEILAALEQGCHVLGSSSMGALRAAELAAYGMRGVGRIYEKFRDGLLEDDDEVAVAHASAEFGFRELSVAMVNLRDMLEGARGAGLIDETEEQALVAHAKSRFYPERTTGDLIATARRWGWPSPRVDRLADHFRNFGPTLKERDAVELLHAIRDLIAEDPAPFAPQTRLERTLFLHALTEEIDRERPPRRPVDATASVAETGLALFALRKEALVQLLARRLSDANGWEVTAGEIEMAWEQLRQSAGLEDAEAEARWFAETGMTPDGTRSRLHDMIALQKVEERFSPQIDRELPDLASVLGAFRRRS